MRLASASEDRSKIDDTDILTNTCVFLSILAMMTACGERGSDVDEIEDKLKAQMKSAGHR